MSVQNVNLLHAGLLPERVRFNFNELLIGWTALVVILAIVTAFRVHEYQQTAAAMTKLQR